MARVLGASGYGALAGSMALFIVWGQFCGLGSGVILLRAIARGGALQGRFAATQLTYLLSGIALALLALPVSHALLGTWISSQALVLLAVVEILVAPALQPLVFRYQAEERMFLSSAIGTLAPIARLAAITTAAVLGWHDINAFVQLYLAWLMPTVTVVLYLAWPRGTTAKRISIRQTIREGLPYVVSGAALTAGRELDKTVLLRLAGEAITGAYSAAYRIAWSATLPVTSLIRAALPRMLRVPSGAESRLQSTMLAGLLVYAVLASAALWLLAPFALLLLGRGFDDAIPLLRALCFIIVTGSLRQYVSALLTSRDLQVSRNVIEIGGVGISLVAMLLLVPGYGAYGAVMAIVISDICAITIGGARSMRKSLQDRGTAPRVIKKLLQRVIEYSGPGRWIYTRRVLLWTNDDSLVGQLPPRLRLFCKYASAYNKHVGTRTVLFGNRLYRLLRISETSPKQARVEIHASGVWLDLTNPGSLNAINVIRDSSNVGDEIKELSKTASVFIDVGANQGVMTIIASRNLPPGAKIIAIEPQSNLASCIARTLEEQRPDGNWHVIQSAVGRHSSTAQIVIPRENFGQAHLREADEQSTRSVTTIDVISLDSLLPHIESGSTVVVKMDIEGYEFEALAGARELIKRFKPTLILEVNQTALSRYHRTVSELGELLQDLGYDSWRECGEDHEDYSIQNLREGYCGIVLRMPRQDQR